MPKKTIKFISGFLIPSLDNAKFGNHLKWIDKSLKKFQIDWRHKGGPGWTEQEAKVFVEWDKYKGHFHPNQIGYFTKSKQRFRAMLYKLTLNGQLKKIECEDKNIKIYCIGRKPPKRRCHMQDIQNDEEEFVDGMSEEETNVHNLHFMKEISEKDVLEDHSYSITNNIQKISKDEILSDLEASLYDQLLVSPEKHVLGQKICGFDEALLTKLIDCSQLDEENMKNDPYWTSLYQTRPTEDSRILTEIPLFQIKNNPFYGCIMSNEETQ